MACRVFPAATVAVPTVPLPADQVLAGVDGLEVGVWEHTAGSSTDVEVDEVFVVLRGRATIEVEGGPELQVGPGDLGLLEAGSRTRWHVHEPLRKVYVAAAGD
ncbi:MAG: cupin domain-containing protein [Kineosporiaceae bacterium]